MDKKINVRVTGNADELGSSLGQASKHIENFKSHTEHSTVGLHQFAGASRLANRELGHFMHGFALGPIGAFAIGIRSITEALRAQNEAAEKAAESNKEFLNNMKHRRMEFDQKEKTMHGRSMDEIGGDMAKLRTEKLDILSTGSLKRDWSKTLSFAVQNFFTGGKYGQQQVMRLQEIQSQEKMLRAEMNTTQRGNGSPFAGERRTAASSMGPEVMAVLSKVANNTASNGNPNSHFE